MIYYRRSMARKIEKAMYNYLQRKWLALQNNKAIFIQSVYRAHLARVYTHWWRNEANTHALDIQRVWRGKIGRDDTEKFQAAMFLIVPELQRIVRGVQGRVKRDALIVEMENAWKWLGPSMPRVAFHR